MRLSGEGDGREGSPICPAFDELGTITGKEAVMIELTLEQQQALDACPQVPAKVTDQVTGRIEVLLPWDDFEWIRGLLGNEPDAPRRIDARTGKEYAVLP